MAKILFVIFLIAFFSLTLNGNPCTEDSCSGTYKTRADQKASQMSPPQQPQRKQKSFIQSDNTVPPNYNFQISIKTIFSRGTWITFQISYLKSYPEGSSALFEARVSYESGSYTFMWFLDQNPIKSSKRVKITHELFNSTLELSPILLKDAGSLTCHVLELDKNITIDVGVLRSPNVTVSPSFVKVFGYAIETFDIFFYSPFNADPEINWYLNNLKVAGEHGPSIRLPVNEPFRLKCGIKVDGFEEKFSNEAIVENVPISGDCKEDLQMGHVWGPYFKNRIELAPCFTGYSGIMRRKCLSKGRWGKVNKKNCRRIKLGKMEKKIKDVGDSAVGVDPDSMLSLSQELRALVYGEDFEEEEEDDMVTLIYMLATTRETADGEYDEYEVDSELYDEKKFMLEMKNVVECMDELIRKMNTGHKDCDQSCLVLMMKSLNVYSSTKTYQPDFDTQPGNGITFERQMLRRNIEKASFPDWRRYRYQHRSTISLLPSFFKQRDSSLNYYISSFFVEDVATLLPTNDGTSYINSAFISMDVAVEKKNLLDLGGAYFVEYTMEHLKPTNASENISCVFWDFSMSANGGWSNRGCQLRSRDSIRSTCRCNHLTNFALLVSPNQKISETDKRVLSIISVVGCSISLLALVLTIIYYAVFWSRVKSKRSALVINLCGALIIANVVLLIEFGLPDYKKASCRALAILLHLFYLAAFFCMLAISIHLLLSVFYVFYVIKKRLITLMIVLSWVLPLIIVLISMGATQLEGYGSYNNCWLSLKNGLLWAFVGPALIIILFNIGVTAAVLVKICTLNNPIKDKQSNKLKSSARNLFVLNPVLGLTWIFGVLAVNEHLVVFQYIFTIANSLQGLFIFILYALCHKSNKPAMAKSMKTVERMTKKRESHADASITSSNNSGDMTTTSDMSSSTSEMTEQEYVHFANTRYKASVKNNNF